MVKKIFFLMTMSVGMMFPSMAQNVPSYLSTNGLVGWWPFNGNANDESGNGNHGTVNGATLTTDRNGSTNAAYNFNGSSWINITTSDNLNLVGDFSISAWVYLEVEKPSNTNNQHHFILSKNAGVTNEGTWHLSLESAYNSPFQIHYNADPCFCLESMGGNSSIITSKEWQLVNVTYNSLSKELKYYKNGIETYKSTKFNYTNKITAYDLLIGKENIGVQGFFIGKIDDIAIYNRALKQQEISALYTSTLPTTNCFVSASDSTICTGETVTLTSNLTDNNTIISPAIYGNSIIQGSIFEYSNTAPPTGWLTSTGGWSQGALPFIGVNTGSVPNSTFWPLGSTYYLRKQVDLSNYDLSSINWSIAVDNGYKLYLNGNLISSDNQGGPATEWEYTGTFPKNLLIQGINNIAVIISDDGSGAASFNMKVTGNSGKTYLWSNGSTTPSINVSPTQTTTYSCTVTNQGLNCTDDVTIIVNNPTATLTPQGNTNFCQGSFVNLNASTGVNYTYQWYNNGQIINGATASTYQANTAGNYTVKVMDGTCSTTSSATTVVVNQYPSSNVQISGNTTICEGSTVTLTAQGSGSYLWSNGSTSQTIKVNQTGSYNVAVTQNGCTSNSSSTSITVNPNPTASITPQGNTTFCQGGFVNLVANGGTSYQWNTGASNSTISANQSGTYTVNVFNSFGCQATASQVVTVNTNPMVTFNGLNEYTLKNQPFVQLTGAPAGGTFIGEGVQGSTFTPANVALGKKTITYNYTSPQGCSGSATRSTFVVDSIGNVCSVTKYDTILKLKFKLTTGINANQMTSMTLYPNPTTDVLYIEVGDAKALDGYRYRILDAVGKEVYNQLVKNPKTEISLKSLGAAGMYLFEVIDQQNKTIQSNKIVLE